MTNHRRHAQAMLCLFLKIIIFHLYLLPAFSMAQADFDNDGIPDSSDVDDDNDGIYDQVENSPPSQDIVTWFNLSNVSISGNDIYFENGILGWNNGTNSQTFSNLGFLSNYKVSFSINELNGYAAIGLGLQETNYHPDDIDIALLFSENNFTIYRNGEPTSAPISYSLNDTFALVFDINYDLNIYQNQTLKHTESLGAYNSFYVDTSFLGRSLKNTNAVFRDFVIESLGDSDLDNDGFINSMDLDSDGDGCNDVLEAGFSDPDNDGILGLGTPSVYDTGAVVGVGGYQNPGSDFLNPAVNEACLSAIKIITSDMPVSSYEIISGATTIENLTSGNPNSENIVEVTSGLNLVYINVFGGSFRDNLHLRLTTLGGYSIDEVEVLVNSQWLQFSTEYYTIEGNKIFFGNILKTYTNPFVTNLVDGVIYNNNSNFIVTVTGDIDLIGSKMTIIGPNNFTSIIPVNVANRTFVWNGTTAAAGKYKFLLSIHPGPSTPTSPPDNATYVGQFFIK
ncbi:MAG: hypothetical protein Q8P20_03810 [bacterium]|nr:hypothetical protein [bacterium]